jgi:hypothetical protein
MKFDAHKAKASLNWKKKHGIPTRAFDKKPEPKPLPSNAYRFNDEPMEVLTTESGIYAIQFPSQL